MFQWFFLLYSFPLNFFSVRLDTNQRLFLPKWEFFFYVLSFSDAQKLSSRHSFRYWGEININTSFIHGVFIIIFYSVEPPFFSWFILLYPICLENVSRHLERFIFWKTTFLNSNLIRAPSRHIDDGGGCKRMNIFSERGKGGGALCLAHTATVSILITMATFRNLRWEARKPGGKRHASCVTHWSVIAPVTWKRRRYSVHITRPSQSIRC